MELPDFVIPRNDFMQTQNKWISILETMNRTLKRRGPDDEGTYLSSHCGLSHVRLEIIDLLTGHQPMLKQNVSGTYSIVFNGEIYNMKPLREELKKKRCGFCYHKRYRSDFKWIYAPSGSLYQKIKRYLCNCDLSCRRKNVSGCSVTV
mgnify:CR=1 FL=1